MARYTEILALRQPLLDDFYGEQLQIVPWIVGDVLAGGPDPSQPAFIVVGILDAPTRVERVEGAAGVIGARSDVTACAPQVDFAESVFGPAAPQPLENWRITAIERDGSPTFRIIGLPRPDGVGRLVCSLLKV